MGKISILALIASTVVLLITFGQGIGVLHGGDVAAHLNWSMATLLTVLAANFFAMIHAAQSDRLIHQLRTRLEQAEGPMDSPVSQSYISGPPR